MKIMLKKMITSHLFETEHLGICRCCVTCRAPWRRNEKRLASCLCKIKVEVPVDYRPQSILAHWNNEIIQSERLVVEIFFLRSGWKKWRKRSFDVSLPISFLLPLSIKWKWNYEVSWVYCLPVTYIVFQLCGNIKC